ncbi:phosphoglycerate kinase [Blattabacterium cuenoti]|uniref:phosphoglycerate kinase n=1 Tax=Blattabacterium cuenoti TaxID=1653831 RepID=UPI00163CB97F|nr:phosphoglycerate kinase [Blattabacterium cuenoti]
MIIKNINNFNFENKIALIRVDYNVPINNNYEIIDDTRIQYSIPTIQKIICEKGKVVLISHFGRPKGKRLKNLSLKFLVPFLTKKFGIPVKFCDDCIGNNVINKIKKLKSGDILLLENLRFYKEEEEENYNFGQELSKNGDIYVNDAFSVAHRNHSSIITTPKFFLEKKCMGFLMKKEIENFKKFFSGQHKKPITVILGGSKVSSKLNIIKSLIDFSNFILIGGGMAYPFIKKKYGGKIGNSLTEKYSIIENTLEEILSELNKKNKNNILLFPKDVVISKTFDNNKNTKIVPIHSIPNGWIGLDIGPKSIKYFCNIIEKSKTILWNGPLGVFEFSNFSIGTKKIAKKISEITKNGAYSLVGGGDSIAALKMEKCEKKVSYLSTGGGSMLEILKNKVLPGIKSLYI